MDEQPVPLLKETRVPIAATRTHGRRVAYDYERHGTASIVMCAEPLAGFRHAPARTRRTNADWASEVAHRLDTREATCEAVTRVCDHRNTHTQGAFYEAFDPARARADIKRSNFCDTPQHGRWLKVAECKRSCFTSPWLRDRRSGAWPKRPIDIAAWSNKTTARHRGVDWPCRIDNARVKLKRLYPKIKA